ncbi:MAG: hypothetical protein P8L85_11375 [Rubripirellula sp.]|nr:hypothetical protein [Rubripirellula sp.]
MNRRHTNRKFTWSFASPSRSTAKPRSPVPPPIEVPIAEQSVAECDGSVSYIAQVFGWVFSVLLHILLLFTIAMFVSFAAPVDKMVLLLPLTVDESMVEEELVEFLVLEPPEFEIDPVENVVEIEDILQADEMKQLDVPHQVEPPSALVDLMVNSMDSLTMASAPVGLVRLPPATTGKAGHSELGGRASRRMRFTTPEMNYGINKGLMWLARHQLADGGWSFEHRIGECQGRCPNPGSKRSARVAATGLALLPFLGAGHSPGDGEYRQTVSAGIDFLIANTASDGSLWRSEGRMYGHGIATLALCECYGMLTQTPPNKASNSNSTEPRPAYGELANATNALGRRWTAVDVARLKQAATAAVGFIVRAQAVDGGWRYRPGELGDMSVVGWQVMALKSAKDAGLGGYEQSFAGAQMFLNSVQLDPVGSESYGVIGTRYRYKSNTEKATPATTAIGLACRICMGASPFHPAAVAGVNRIVTEGHSGSDMYYNFYANQVVFQHGGVAWESWNQRLSNALIQLQCREGHLEGSWHFGGDHGSNQGGRVYTTAMACLCLEESFRHLPTFRMNAQRRFNERLRAKSPEVIADEESGPALQQPGMDEFPLGD